MGYRNYLYAVPKKQVEEIQSCKTNEDWCNFAQNYGYEVDWDCCADGSGRLAPYKVGTEIYELGNDLDIVYELKKNNSGVFTSEELQHRYSDYGFTLLTKDDFKAIIEFYRQEIIKWLKDLLNPENNPAIPPRLSKEEMWQRSIECKLDKWTGRNAIIPIDLDESTERVTGSWLYEYAIFELVRLYKAFDWENDDLVLVGR